MASEMACFSSCVAGMFSPSLGWFASVNIMSLSLSACSVTRSVIVLLSILGAWGAAAAELVLGR